LDDSAKRLGICRFDCSLLLVRRDHFKRGTICPPVGIQRGITLPELHDVVLHIGGICECEHNIIDGEIPFFLAGVPSAADLFFFGKGDGGHGLVAMIYCFLNDGRIRISSKHESIWISGRMAIIGGEVASS